MSTAEPQHENDYDQSELEKDLVLAAERGELDEVKRLVDAGADVMGRYFPSPGTPLGPAVKILELYHNRYRALVELSSPWALEEREMRVNHIGWTPLQAASAGGHLSTVKHLIESGGDVNDDTNTIGRTALQWAARTRNPDLIQLLLDHGAKLNAPPMDLGGMTALQMAAENGCEETVNLLLRLGAKTDQDPAVSSGLTALQAACSSGNLPLVKLLLDHGARIDGSPSRFGVSALSAAAGGGHLNIVELLVKKGADVNFEVEETQDRTALQAAARKGHWKLVEFLLGHKANVNTKIYAYGGRSPLQSAAAQGNSDMLKLLIRQGATVDDEAAGFGGRTALQAAAEIGNIQMVLSLLSSGAEVNRKGAHDHGRTALQAAAEGGHLDIVKRLIEAGASVVEACSYSNGRTSLQAAAGRGHMGIARLLHQAGAEPNAEPSTVDGLSALQAAAAGGHEEMVNWLMSIGAHDKADDNADPNADPNANAKPAVRTTALREAAQHGHTQIARFLLLNGAKVNVKGTLYDDGINALYAAVREGHMEMVKLLVEAGDREAFGPGGDSGQTPLQAAAERGHVDIAKDLVASGADLTFEPAGSGRTALQDAVLKGHEEMVRWLLTENADIHAKSSIEGKTTIEYAVSGGDKEIVQMLVRAGASKSLAFRAAAAEGDLRIVKMLHSQGVSAEGTVEGEDGDDSTRINPLQAAAARGAYDVVRFLLRNKANIHPTAPGVGGKTALQAAAGGRNLQIIDYLLSEGAGINEVTAVDRNTPLKTAIMADYETTAKFLLKKGASIDDLTPEQVQKVITMLKDELPEQSKSKNDGSHLILLSNDRSAGTQIKLTTGESFDIHQWDIYEWEKNKKTSILLPSSGMEFNDNNMSIGSTVNFGTTTNLGQRRKHKFQPNKWLRTSLSATALTDKDPCSSPNQLRRCPQDDCTFLNPGDFIPHKEYPDIPRGEGLTRWAWSSISRREGSSYINVRPFRNGFPNTQDIKSNVLFVPYIRFRWRPIPVEDQSAKPVHTITVVHLTPEGTEISEFTRHEHDIVISWVMAKRNIKKKVDSPIQAIHFRGNLTQEVPSIPDSAARFAVWCLKDVHDHWGKLLKEATQHLEKIGNFQLTDRRPSSDMMVSLLLHSRVWNDLQETLDTHVQQAYDLVEQFKKSEVLYGELRTLPSMLSSDSAGQENPEDFPVIRELGEMVNQIRSRKIHLESLQKLTKDLMNLEFNLVTIHEAQESGRISRSMKRLSWITFIFLPLMFVSGLFGMNVDILESNPSWKWYLISAAPVMAFVMFVWLLFKSKSLLRWHKTNTIHFAIPNPKNLFGRTRREKGDVEMGDKRKDHND